MGIGISDKIIVPVWEKYALTIKEAVQYFGIGEKTMRRIIEQNSNSNFIICNGSKYLIKRKSFESFLDSVTSI